MSALALSAKESFPRPYAPAFSTSPSRPRPRVRAALPPRAAEGKARGPNRPRRPRARGSLRAPARLGAPTPVAEQSRRVRASVSARPATARRRTRSGTPGSR
eukprot:9967377-Alexandrium_andersonii.AAC.1